MKTIAQIHDALQKAAAEGRALDVAGYRARALAAGRRGKSVAWLRSALVPRDSERVEVFVDEWATVPPSRVRCWERTP